MKVVADERVGLRRGVDLVAGHLGAPAARWDVRIDGVRRRLVPLGSGRRIEAEPQRLLAAMLYARAGVIDAVGGQSRRRAGLEATQFQAGVSQVVGQRGGGRFAATTAGRHRIAHDDPALQERSGGDDGGVGANLLAGAGADAAHAPGGRPVQRFRFPDEAVHMGLEERQVLLRLEQAAHEHAVGMLVALGAQGADGRSFAGVQLADLDLGAVGVAAHFAAERVDLTYEVALGGAADRWVAGHLGDGVEVGAQERRAPTHARRGQGRLAAGVAGADDQDIEGTAARAGVSETHGPIFPRADENRSDCRFGGDIHSDTRAAAIVAARNAAGAQYRRAGLRS